MVTDSSGAQYGYTRYYPYGSTRTSSGSLDTSMKFTGQRLDGTGLYYYGARYYDPTIGRFISADSIVPNWTNPQSLNRYSYCLNNPLRYTDPTGHQDSGTTYVTVPGIMGQMALQTAQACGYTNYSTVGSTPPPPTNPTPPPVVVRVPPSMMVQQPQPALPSAFIPSLTQNQGPTINAAPQNGSQANVQEPEPNHSAVENFIYKTEITAGILGLGFYTGSVFLSGPGAPVTALALSPLAVASWEVLADGLNRDYGEDVVPSLHSPPEVLNIPLKALIYIWSSFVP